ncbi:MAG: UDP-N-acetyl-D-mannosamine dehydrogenase [Actinobacteria bacterium]|nr:UDP-N-acetyl-D-mannosamine dehydrogenase [Actinomycetota bacterium]
MGKWQTICVIGLGYIGLPTASILATKGYKVLGVDVAEQAVAMINEGKIHIVEPDLDILVKSAVHSGNLKASLTPDKADVFIIAVPTPFKDDHKPDLSYVDSATDVIAPFLSEGNLVILESTSPVGTTDRIAEQVFRSRPELEGELFVAHCPERVLPGQILKELVNNDRIIGGVDVRSAKEAKEFYQTFVNGQIFTTNAKTAEFTKLAENSYRDVNIAFANELSMICHELSINPWEVIELANKHPRVNILQPGPGVGGHCIAVDPWFIVDSAPDKARLIRTARDVNDSKPYHVVSRVKEKAIRFKEPIIACLGLSFKADIDDLRESPAVEIVQDLAADNVGKILVVEPHIEKLPDSLAGLAGIELAGVDDALQHADIVLLLADHRIFKEIDRNVIKEKIVIDTRGMWQ